MRVVLFIFALAIVVSASPEGSIALSSERRAQELGALSYNSKVRSAALASVMRRNTSQLRSMLCDKEYTQIHGLHF